MGKIANLWPDRRAEYLFREGHREADMRGPKACPSLSDGIAINGFVAAIIRREADALSFA
jgi:hypothetical protein